MGHVLSRTMGSQNKRDAPKDIDKASDDISNLSGSAKMKDINSNEIDESPTPSTNFQSIKESSNIISETLISKLKEQKESTQLRAKEKALEIERKLTSLLAERQNDLINLDYIKNYNNP